VLRADIEGPRGPVRVFAVMLDWPPRGQPVAVRAVGQDPVDGVVASDHFGVLAELRY
jgi:hypothetical protein